MSPHTPGPWEAQGSRVLAPRPGERRLHDGSIQNDVDTLVAKARRPTDARFIVKAANNHERLVAVLEDYFEGPDLDADAETQRLQHAGWVRRVRAALRAVEESE